MKIKTIWVSPEMQELEVNFFGSILMWNTWTSITYFSQQGNNHASATKVQSDGTQRSPVSPHWYLGGNRASRITWVYWRCKAVYVLSYPALVKWFSHFAGDYLENNQGGWGSITMSPLWSKWSNGTSQMLHLENYFTESDDFIIRNIIINSFIAKPMPDFSQ